MVCSGSRIWSGVRWKIWQARVRHSAVAVPGIMGSSVWEGSVWRTAVRRSANHQCSRSRRWESLEETTATRAVWRGGCENTNQRSPSQRREQAGESQGRPRKTRVSGGSGESSGRAGAVGRAVGEEVGMGEPCEIQRLRAVGYDRWKERPGTRVGVGSSQPGMWILALGSFRKKGAIHQAVSGGVLHKSPGIGASRQF